MLFTQNRYALLGIILTALFNRRPHITRLDQRIKSIFCRQTDSHAKGSITKQLHRFCVCIQVMELGRLLELLWIEVRMAVARVSVLAGREAGCCRRVCEDLPEPTAGRAGDFHGRVGCVRHERPERTPGAWTAGLRTTRGWQRATRPAARDGGKTNSTVSDSLLLLNRASM